MENTNIMPETGEENLSEQMQIRRAKLKALQEKGNSCMIFTDSEPA